MSTPLLTLNPSWIRCGGAGIYDKDMKPTSERSGIGLDFDCPCGKPHGDNPLFPGQGPLSARVHVFFHNPLDGGPKWPDGSVWWHRTGDTFETISLTPSILRDLAKGGCGWHGFVTNGQVLTC